MIQVNVKWRAEVENRVVEVANRLKDPQVIAQHELLYQEEVGRQGGEADWMETSLGNGYVGICVLFGAMDQLFPEQGWDLAGHAYLVATQQSLQKESGSSLSLFAGFAGVSMGVRALSRGGTRYQKMQAQLQDILLRQCPRVLAQADEQLQTGAKMHDYDVIAGLTGVGRYMLMEAEQPEMRQTLSEVLQFLVKLSGVRDVFGQQVPAWYIPFEKSNSYEQNWYPRGHFNLGLSHGIPGPLALMSLALQQGIEVPGQREAMVRIVEFLLRFQQEDEYGAYWSKYVSWEEFVQGKASGEKGAAAWCYGTLGVARAIWLAGEALQEETWKQMAVEAFLAELRRPEETWRIYAPILCHGYAGVLLMTHRMYEDSGNAELESHRERLLQDVLAMYDQDSAYGFGNVVTTADGKRVKRDSAGFLDGAAGAALALLSLIGPRDLDWDAALLIR